MKLPCKMCEGCNLSALPDCDKDCVVPTLNAVMDDINTERQAELKRIQRREYLAIYNRSARKARRANCREKSIVMGMLEHLK